MRPKVLVMDDSRMAGQQVLGAELRPLTHAEPELYVAAVKNLTVAAAA